MIADAKFRGERRFGRFFRGRTPTGKPIDALLSGGENHAAPPYGGIPQGYLLGGFQDFGNGRTRGCVDSVPRASPIRLFGRRHEERRRQESRSVKRDRDSENSESSSRVYGRTGKEGVRAAEAAARGGIGGSQVSESIGHPAARLSRVSTPGLLPSGSRAFAPDALA